MKPFLVLQRIRARRAIAIASFALSALVLHGLNPAYAQLDPPEEIIFIDKAAFMGSVKLETTIYKPPGTGPFPLVIINHGKQLGDPHLQKRFEPLSVALYFLERGYVVFVPMRHGFSKSGGEYQFHGNSAEMAGRDQVRDIDVTIQYAHTLPYVKKDITLVVGYSEGGWITLAYGASQPNPSVRGIINFSGGVRDPCCIGLLEEMIDVSKKFGAQTTVASIWFYGDNDSLFNRYVSDKMFANYARGNPNSRFIPYGNFSTDAHALFIDPNGRTLWEPFLTQFLHDVQAPYKAINPPYKLNLQKK